MKDKQLKDMCILLGIQLPAESYDSIKERLRAREVQPDYVPAITAFMSAAEACGRVLEAEEANGANLEDEFDPLYIATQTLWSTVEFLVDSCYDRGLGATGMAYVRDSEGKDLIPLGSMILGCHSISPPCPEKDEYGIRITPDGMMHLTPEIHNYPEFPQPPCTGVIGRDRDVYHGRVRVLPGSFDSTCPVRDMSAKRLVIKSETHNPPEFPEQASTGLIGHTGDDPCEGVPMGPEGMKYSLPRRMLNASGNVVPDMLKTGPDTPNRDK